MKTNPVCKLFPSMSDEELSGLTADIKANGLREKIWLDSEERVIDGRNRIRACKAADVEPKFRTWNGKGSLVGFVVSLNLHRRHLTASQRGMVATDIEEILAAEAKDRMSQGGKGVTRIPPLETGKSRDQAASIVGVSASYVSASKVIKKADPELADRVRLGERTITEATRELKERKREDRRDQNREIVASSDTPEVVVGKARFATIVMDPPWDFSEEGDNDVYGRTRPTYKQMKASEILSLPVEKFADEDCHLYLWITNRSLMTGKGWKLCEAWGFRPITLLTWCKPSIGVGNYFRNNTEHVIFAVKGQQSLKVKDAGTWFEAKRGPKGHSSKPPEFSEMVESWSPGPFLEMFARSTRDGWVSWGAEA